MKYYSIHALILLLSITLYADRNSLVHVSPCGDDFNNGSASHPVRTIVRALDLAEKYDADEVRVEVGTYVESGLLLRNGVHLKGGFYNGFTRQNLNFDAAMTIIQGPKVPMQISVQRILCADNITEETILEGFKITNGQIEGEGAGMLITNCGEGLKVRKNLFVDNRAIYQAGKGGNIAAVNSAAYIQDNVFFEGFAGYGGADMYLEGSYVNGCSPIVQGNYFTSEAAVSNSSATVIDIRNNRFLDHINAIYVSAELGTDAAKGTMLEPVQTITQGLLLAAQHGAYEVRVAQGEYRERNITLVDGIDLLGGYTNCFMERNIDLETGLSTINAPDVDDARLDAGRVITAENILDGAVLEGFVITNGQVMGDGGGLLINNCTRNFVVRNNVITRNRAIYFGSRGGNVASVYSIASVHDNIITDGFCGSGLEYGMDLYVEGSCDGGTPPAIFNNTFTGQNAVVCLYDVYFADNCFIENQIVPDYPVGIAMQGNDAPAAVSLPGIASGNISGCLYELYNVKGQLIGTFKNTALLRNGMNNSGYGNYIMRAVSPAGTSTRLIAAGKR